MNRVQQHQKQSTTVRDIVRKARGRNVEREERQDMAAAFFGNFPKDVDLQECLNHISRAREQFECFPAEIRQEFGNDPSNLIRFVQDEKNYEKAVSMGLISIEAQQRREAARIKAIKEAQKTQNQIEKEGIGTRVS